MSGKIVPLLVILAGLAVPLSASADELSPEVQKTIDRGLEWLAKQQHGDGHWDSNRQYAPAMTALSGLALAMEGSTLRDGKYSPQIKKAVDWLVEKSRPNGMIGIPNDPGEGARYMYGHGYALLFLASVYGEEEGGERRRKLEDVLTRAVQFTGKAQTSKGGFGYVSAADGSDFAEGSVTITQIQGLRAARNAGIVVPKEVIDKTRAYLELCTNEQDQVGYYPGRKAITPGLTPAGIACMFNSGDYDNKLVKRWFKYCQRAIPNLGSAGRQGHDEYTHYYYAQALYILGEDGWGKLFPGDKEAPLTWSKYRKPTFEYLVKSQSANGSWDGMGTQWHVGPVFVSAIHLAILQLDKGTLPIYQR